MALLLGSASLGFPSPADETVDEVHPRSPGTPLKIEFQPCHWREGAGDLNEQMAGLVMTRAPVAELAKTLGLPKNWIAVESPHFKLLSTLKASSVKYKGGTFVRADLGRLQMVHPKTPLGHDGARLSPLQLATLYIIRAERIYSHFVALTACKAPFLGMAGKYELYLFQDYATHHAYVDRFVGGRQDRGGVQWHFREQPNFLAFTTCADLVGQAHGRGDAALSNHFVHNVAHNLADGYGNYYRETWAWLEEGLAHYYERRQNIRINNFCWAEGASPTEFLKPDWEATIFALVRRERDVPFPQWCEKLQPGELSGVENGMSWGLVKWMVETEPVRFTKMISKIDDTVGQPSAAQCIQEAFGVSVSVLYQRWRDYVLENYK